MKWRKLGRQVLDSITTELIAKVLLLVAAAVGSYFFGVYKKLPELVLYLILCILTGGIGFLAWRVITYKSQLSTAGIIFFSVQDQEKLRVRFEEKIRESAHRSETIRLCLTTGKYVIVGNERGDYSAGFLRPYVDGTDEHPTGAVRTIKVILNKEGCPAAHRRADQLGMNPSQYDRSVQNTKDFLNRIHAPHVEYCESPATPTWRLFIFDDVIFVQYYLDNNEGRMSFAMGFSKSENPTFYDHFSNYFDRIWNELTTS